MNSREDRSLRTRELRWALLVGLTLAPGPGPARGQEPPAVPAAKDARPKWAPVFQKHAAGYIIRAGAGAGDQAEARMLPEPLLRWSQPVRGGDDGALYLWVREGRPVAVMSLFTYKERNGVRNVIHEDHSLAEGPLAAEWAGQPRWRTAEPGLTFRPVPDAPAPAETAAARLRQMQAIVREFSAATKDDKGSTWTLRPMTRALYRYEGKGPATPDGALFAFAQGTDPEAFLLVEARAEWKALRWEYAVARFTDLEIKIDLKGREVFSGPHTVGGPGGIYWTTIVMSRPGDAPEDFERP